MRKLVGLTATAALIALSFVMTTAPARAITNNYVEDFDHPFVGLIAFYVADDGATTDPDSDPDFSHRCSGSLLSPTVFLTAGHCTDESGGDLIYARVWFQQDAGAHYDPATQLDLVTGYPEYCAAGTLGTMCATATEMYNMGFANFAGFPNTQDAGVVILDQAISLNEYATLASPGTLDEITTPKGNTTLTVSGYGVSHSSKQGTVNVSFRERLMATSTLTNLKSSWNDGFNVQTNGNGSGRGGTCSGDSGGPVFYPADANQVVAVTSFGKSNAGCRGTDYAFRVDTAAVHAWLRSVLSAAEWSSITIS
jgi:hypothetical protein